MEQDYFILCPACQGTGGSDLHHCFECNRRRIVPADRFAGKSLGYIIGAAMGEGAVPIPEWAIKRTTP
jgi:hypothetical protein